MALAPVQQILMGSDFPYVPLGDTTEGLFELGLATADVEAITRGNALRLMPGLSNR